MATALSWLNDLFQWLGRWIPRFVLIHPTHCGVLFGLKGSARSVGSGLVIYWPITNDPIQVPVTMQSIQLAGVVLDFPQNESPVPRAVICALNVQFTICDPVKASVKALHFHALVANRAQSLVVSHWNGNKKNLYDHAFIELAEEQLDREMPEYGIDVQSLHVASMGVGVVLKQAADWSYSDSATGKRPD